VPLVLSNPVVAITQGNGVRTQEPPLVGKDRPARKIRHYRHKDLCAALRAGAGRIYSCRARALPGLARIAHTELPRGDMGEKNEGMASVYMAFRGVMSRAVRRIVPTRDVEDILQEAFVRSYEAQSRHPILDARAFLLRTATNLALNHVARAGYRTTGSIDDIDAERAVDQEAQPPDVQVDAERRFLSFCRAVGGLPDQCRRVFVLKKIYGMSQEEIAAELGIAQSTVEKHIAKGLLLCREAMIADAVPQSPRLVSGSGS
jgi:RNA polymerase sigma factor (sigma-70 family)